jgi:hypothetical protein
MLPVHEAQNYKEGPTDEQEGCREGVASVLERARTGKNIALDRANIRHVKQVNNLRSENNYREGSTESIDSREAGWEAQARRNY